MNKCMDRPVAGTKHPGHYREVAIVGRWPILEVRLYFIICCRIVQLIYIYMYISNYTRLASSRD